MDKKIKVFNHKIAKLTSYVCYLDCEFITAKFPDENVHIVGDVAEYVYDLEQENESLINEINLLKIKFNAHRLKNKWYCKPGIKQRNRKE